MSIFKSILNLFSSTPMAQADAAVATVLGLVHEAEGLYPAGADKLEHVRVNLERSWHKFDALAVSFQDAWPVISSMITALVSLYKASGAFKRKAN
jgi:hypothetical protein